MSSRRPDYSDDIFADSRMPFTEHIEELRKHIIRALYGFAIFLVIGFVFDSIGWMTNTGIGLGKPAFEFIKEPVEEQVKEFYDRRLQRVRDRIKALEPNSDSKLRNTTELKAEIDVASLKPHLKFTEEPSTPTIPITIRVPVVDVFLASKDGENDSGSRKYLTTLGVQEAFVVYFKVSILCGVILSSPWLFYQAWSFVGVGLYPHERRYVHVYLPFSIGLFLAGAALCQFVALPKAVGALLAFNDWLDLDPDLRLSEWLGFAVIMPLVFGVSFQTPIFMIFFQRIGLFTADDYVAQWRVAVMSLAVVAAVLTPTPDAVSMSVLFVPMFGLYWLGIVLCRLSPVTGPDEDLDELDDVSI
ncbi:twin-arginine translocase subunit TatC [Tuwongella immobilis]|uniref:Sec-independent protein translocase protein TatC n=1 Tax=Tuwongella immobilis TaxID=692036 RepID=A0A6C2YQI9_9BACT|nr:twin-arginine translocase subunit TatC [Tuwongella immobilis]VIP03908.1 sec-independent protein subunit : Sec-independent protein translocase protein TatC OS=Singulisphaera acidiphila (strain ATCC BAA-1392 / DSM 18658 / VKM B-2454 / MOB10) GN=tatC PE=3 SV=1: TatC [Tuwongella immobilis]VTS05183.1 sec-independent protein subunit : Sec-independent protein translocase protein TatC OS=Singulisphaera acidiphila (strain ATCC BAA-1392 / DSM 18658 / VKM B-2454 / MOB10) GN=tatC PE=3 SV=1: TatC [Tuwongel